MVGLAIQIPGVAFAPANILIPGLPQVGTTTLWTYFATSLANSPNLMPGAPAFTPIGTPVFAPGTAGNYVTLTAANYLDTNLLDDAKSFTYLFATRLGATTGTAYPLSLQETTALGTYATLTNSGGLTTRVYGNGVSINNWLMGGAGITTVFKCWAIAYNDTTTRMDVYNLTDNTTTGFTGNLVTRTAAATGHLLLGNSVTQAAATAPLDMAFAGRISGTCWTLAQCQQAYANIKFNLALQGITV
jgi:hypothetical protein